MEDWDLIDDPVMKYLLEGERVDQQADAILLNTGEFGVVYVTNFRLIFLRQTTYDLILLGTIPLTAIEELSLSSQELVQVTGKDTRVILFDFGHKRKERRDVLEALRKHAKPTCLDDLYPFSKIDKESDSKSRLLTESKIDTKSDSKLRLLKEYQRLLRDQFLESPSCGFEVKEDSLANSWWRLSTANSEYKLCSTYPSQLIVPRNISYFSAIGNIIDDDLLIASRFRAGNRLPVISWCDPGTGAVLARSSQPLVGYSSRNNADEKLVSALCTQVADDTGSPRKFYIVDARSKITAFANQAKGGGTESSDNYPNSEVFFLGIGNINNMKVSISKVREYVDAHGSITSNRTSSAVSLVRHQSGRGSSWVGRDPSGITQYSSTLGIWLNHLQNILCGASWIAAQIIEDSASVLVHCSDEWDRTTQLTALACLMLDPYYRTFTGFQALVEKDWLAFGHPFAERMGIPTTSEKLLLQKSQGPIVPPAVPFSLNPWIQYYFRWICPQGRLSLYPVTCYRSLPALPAPRCSPTTTPVGGDVSSLPAHQNDSAAFPPAFLFTMAAVVLPSTVDHIKIKSMCPNQLGVGYSYVIVEMPICLTASFLLTWVSEHDKSLCLLILFPFGSMTFAGAVLFFVKILEV